MARASQHQCGLAAGGGSRSATGTRPSGSGVTPAEKATVSLPFTWPVEISGRLGRRAAPSARCAAPYTGCRRKCARGQARARWSETWAPPATGGRIPSTSASPFSVIKNQPRERRPSAIPVLACDAEFGGPERRQLEPDCRLASRDCCPTDRVVSNWRIRTKLTRTGSDRPTLKNGRARSRDDVLQRKPRSTKERPELRFCAFPAAR